MDVIVLLLFMTFTFARCLLSTYYCNKQVYNVAYCLHFFSFFPSGQMSGYYSPYASGFTAAQMAAAAAAAAAQQSSQVKS